jgi:hypothetical protein
MAHPQLVLLVKFKSVLPIDEIRAIAERRSDQFRALTGLQQKYYLHNPETGEIAGLYLWESAEALDAYRQSELRATIAKEYKAEGEPRVEVFSILATLRD